MTTYILINSKDSAIIGIYTDREIARKMMRVYALNGQSLYCQTERINNTIPAWAERVLALNEE